MSRNKNCCQQKADIPAWFMTYSDVITLLMTFFILLLTFATNEPERFFQMQSVMFGGGSATGVVGQRVDSLDRDTIVLRQRPRSGRLTVRGSEMPPTYSDPDYGSLSGGLEALTEANEEDEYSEYVIVASLTQLVGEDGTLSELAQRQFSEMGRQLRAMPLGVRMEVSDASRLPAVMSLVQFLSVEQLVPLGRISTAIARDGRLAPGDVRITIDRFLMEQRDGP